MADEKLKDGFPYRARVVWHACDIQTVAEARGLDWDLKMCDDFLLGHEKYLQERLGEEGWEVLDCYFDEWQIAPEGGSKQIIVNNIKTTDCLGIHHDD